MPALQFRIEKTAPPVPKRQMPPRARLSIPLAELKIGATATINRSPRTTYRYIWEFQQTPAGVGTRFKVRKITPSLTRIWRMK